MEHQKTISIFILKTKQHKKTLSIFILKTSNTRKHFPYFILKTSSTRKNFHRKVVRYIFPGKIKKFMLPKINFIHPKLIIIQRKCRYVIYSSRTFYESQITKNEL